MNMDYSPTQQEIDAFFDFGPDVYSGSLDVNPPIQASTSAPDSAATCQEQSSITINTDSPLPDYAPAIYSNHIPTYYKPSVRCGYCISLNLECKVFTNEGNKSCAACQSLFRKCSFLLESNESSRGRVDTLHTVDEDAAQEQGALTGIRPTFTAGASHEDVRRQMMTGRNCRFSKPIVKVLRRWVCEHADDPYPTSKDKEELSAQTGLNVTQLCNWLANARRRGKVSSLATACKQSMAIDVPQKSTQPDPTKTPFERWKDSPPEGEAPVTILARAAATTEFNHDESDSSSRAPSLAERRHSGSGFSTLKTTSGSSFGTGESNESGSGWSHNSSRESYSSFARKQKRRKRDPYSLPPTASTGRHKPSSTSSNMSISCRPFQCTFCVADFRTKYDWLRHEKSMHLNLEKWTCCPDGPVIPVHRRSSTDPVHPVCAYCYHPRPDADHLDDHDHGTCAAKHANDRVFTRKDHLRQHLRLSHNVAFQPHMEKWKSAPALMRSRCGFCDVKFNTWDDRAAHLAKHFRAGCTMARWKGGWGFELEVAACVADAMAPWLIGFERIKGNPFDIGEEDPNGAGVQKSGTDEGRGADLTLGPDLLDVDMDLMGFPPGVGQAESAAAPGNKDPLGTWAPSGESAYFDPTLVTGDDAMFWPFEEGDVVL